MKRLLNQAGLFSGDCYRNRVMSGYLLMLPVVQEREFIEFHVQSTQYYWAAALLALLTAAVSGVFIWLYLNKKRIEAQLRNTNEELEKKVRARTLELELLNRELRHLSVSDALTGIANRRYFDNYLQAEWSKAIRSRQPIALIMIDIDFFKNYNDTYGHQRGDECVIAVAGALQSGIRRTADLAARYGGEEFAVILPDTNAGGAQLFAEILRTAVEHLDIAHVYSAHRKVTISLGVAAVVPEHGSSPAVLIDLADQALYQAKNQGRNQVQLWVADDG